MSFRVWPCSGPNVYFIIKGSGDGLYFLFFLYFSQQIPWDNQITWEKSDTDYSSLPLKSIIVQELLKTRQWATVFHWRICSFVISREQQFTLTQLHIHFSAAINTHSASNVC